VSSEVADGNPLAVLQDEDQQKKQEQGKECGSYLHAAGARPSYLVSRQRYMVLARWCSRVVGMGLRVPWLRGHRAYHFLWAVQLG
jgi:hypothetical protein